MRYEVIVEAIRQSGLAPKVKLPAGVLVGVGIVLVVAGALVPELDTLVDVGVAIAGSGLAALGIGFAAPPGDVVVSPAAVAQAESAPIPRSSEAGISDIGLVLLLLGLVVGVLIGVFLL